MITKLTAYNALINVQLVLINQLIVYHVEEWIEWIGNSINNACNYNLINIIDVK